MIHINVIYFRVTSIFSYLNYLNCFNVYIFAPFAFYFSYCQIMDRFLIKAAFGSEVLIRRKRGAYFEGRRL